MDINLSRDKLLIIDSSIDIDSKIELFQTQVISFCKGIKQEYDILVVSLDDVLVDYD